MKGISFIGSFLFGEICIFDTSGDLFQVPSLPVCVFVFLSLWDLLRSFLPAPPKSEYPWKGFDLDGPLRWSRAV